MSATPYFRLLVRVVTSFWYSQVFSSNILGTNPAEKIDVISIKCSMRRDELILYPSMRNMASWQQKDIVWSVRLGEICEMKNVWGRRTGEVASLGCALCVGRYSEWLEQQQKPKARYPVRSELQILVKEKRKAKSEKQERVVDNNQVLRKLSASWVGWL